MKSSSSPSVTAVAPWFGSNRMLAPIVGQELTGCSWVGVPFAGGMSELVHIGARTLQVNDLHRHVINLARVMAHPKLGPELYRRLRRSAFHPDSLVVAQQRCAIREKFQREDLDLFGGVDRNRVGLATEDGPEPDLLWAIDYFQAAWMPRHGSSGKKGEFEVGISTRWNASGGDSAKHFWSAVDSMLPMRRILQRGNFTAIDAFKFLIKCKDEKETGIYVDTPFPGPGDDYTHEFDVAKQRLLSPRLAEFKHARVVCRFYDIPLIRELYPASIWTWRLLQGRKQTNGPADEVLLINGPSYAKGNQ